MAQARIAVAEMRLATARADQEELLTLLGGFYPNLEPLMRKVAHAREFALRPILRRRSVGPQASMADRRPAPTPPRGAPRTAPSAARKPRSRPVVTTIATAWREWMSSQETWGRNLRP